MKELKSLLQEIGLTDTETAIYLAGLTRPAVDVAFLLAQTNIKRPTIYHAITSLTQKGLVSKRGDGHRLQFVMSSPPHLASVIEQQMEKLTQQKEALNILLPLLSKNTATTGTGLNVSQFEGEAGIKTVIDEALYCKTSRWDLIAPRRNIFSLLGKSYAKTFLEARYQRGIVTRSLWEATDPGRRLSPEEIRARQPRYLPEVMQGKFHSLVILFDDKVALLSATKPFNALLIQSSEIHQTMTALFEGLWVGAREY